MHVRLADESVCIGPPAARDSYLNIPALLAACEITGADAVHPGYGFLSENARFAEILAEHDIHFIGPKPEHIRLMGDKIEAKRTAERLGIPVVPGSDGGVSSDQEAISLAHTLGFPVLVKAAAGGGGRGMKVAHGPEELARSAGDRARRGQGRVRRRRGLSREISRAPAPHRNPGAGRRPRPRHPSRRARLLAAAPPSEDLGGRPLPRAQRGRARRDRRDRRQGDARAQISRRRHGRVPLRGRQVLFHRDEHAHPGRASGDRDDHRHRSRARADPRRRRRRSRILAERREVPRPRHRVPHQCGKSGLLPALARQDRALSSAGRAGRARRFRRLSRLLDPALLRFARRQAHRARQDPRRMPDAAQARARRIRHRRHRDDLPLFRALVREKDIIDGDYHIHWLEEFLASGGMEG